MLSLTPCAVASADSSRVLHPILRRCHLRQSSLTAASYDLWPSTPTDCRRKSGAAAPTYGTNLAPPRSYAVSRTHSFNEGLLGLPGSCRRDTCKPSSQGLPSQAKFLYGSKFCPKEILDLKLMIQSNVYKYLNMLLEWRECFEDEALKEDKELCMSDQNAFAAKTAMSSFLHIPHATNREKELKKARTYPELVAAIVGNDKITALGLTQLKQ